MADMEDAAARIVAALAPVRRGQKAPEPDEIAEFYWRLVGALKQRQPPRPTNPRQISR
jgi:hypothetical protein